MRKIKLEELRSHKVDPVMSHTFYFLRLYSLQWNEFVENKFCILYLFRGKWLILSQMF